MNPFENYGPKLFGLKSQTGKVIYPNSNSNPEFKELSLIEAGPNLWGDLMAGMIMLLLVAIAVMGWSDITYKTNLDLLFGIIILIFLFFASIGLTYRGILKLKSKYNRSSIRVNEKGIRHQESDGESITKFEWEQIESVAIKIFNEQYGISVYLLVLLKNGKLKDIDISLLKKPITNETSKKEYINTMSNNEKQYEELLALIGKYTNNISA